MSVGNSGVVSRSDRKCTKGRCYGGGVVELRVHWCLAHAIKCRGFQSFAIQ